MRRCGLATHYIPSEALPRAEAALQGLGPRARAVGAVDETLRAFEVRLRLPCALRACVWRWRTGACFQQFRAWDLWFGGIGFRPTALKQGGAAFARLMLILVLILLL